MEHTLIRTLIELSGWTGALDCLHQLGFASSHVHLIQCSTPVIKPSSPQSSSAHTSCFLGSAQLIIQRHFSLRGVLCRWCGCDEEMGLLLMMKRHVPFPVVALRHCTIVSFFHFQIASIAASQITTTTTELSDCGAEDETAKQQPPTTFPCTRLSIVQNTAQMHRCLVHFRIVHHLGRIIGGIMPKQDTILAAINSANCNLLDVTTPSLFLQCCQHFGVIQCCFDCFCWDWDSNSNTTTMTQILLILMTQL